MPATIREYKVAKGWRIAIYIFGPAMIAVFIFLLHQSFANDEFRRIKFYFIPVSIGMIIGMVTGIIDAYKSRLIISDNAITSINVFGTRELRFEEIEGFWKEDKFTNVVPAHPDKKRIRISKYREKYSEIQEWLASKFPDLEEQTTIEESKEILNNEHFGLTQEERADKLAKGQRIANILNWTGGIVGAWAFLYPTPYEYAVMACMIVPVVAIIIVKAHRGIIRMDQRKGSAYPSALSAFMFPSFAILLRALSDFEIYDYSTLWPLLAGTNVVLLAVVLLVVKGVQFLGKLDVTALVLAVPLVAMYSLKKLPLEKM